MSDSPRNSHFVATLLVGILIAVAGLTLWSFHHESIESTVPVPLPAIESAASLETAVAPATLEIPVEAVVGEPAPDAFHSPLIDAHLAKLEAERLAAEKAAAEKAEAERLAAEKAAADAAAAAAAAAATPPAQPEPLPKKEVELLYRGMMTRVDGTLLAFIENRTDGTTFYYESGATFLNGSITAIHPRLVTLQLGETVIELGLNTPERITLP